MDGHTQEPSGKPEGRAAPGSSELVESVQACSRSLKDQLAQQRQSPSILATSGASSSSCAPPPRTSSATDELTRETKIKLQGILAESLDDLLAVYADLVVGSAEDRVMKPELENLRTYFRRTARTSKAQDGRQGLIVGTTRRFIHHGVGSGRARQTIQKTPANPTSSPKIAADLQEQDEDEDTHKGSGESKKARLAAPEIGKKIRAGRLARNHGLPQIRQVVKPSRPCYKENNVGGMVEGDKEEEDDDDSDSDDDGELEVYDD
ncbi:hypothetical protein MJO29_014190 [Puccinia striiformis f. sp. tritici]|uniref:Uncharacterized protein n=1 Tax=Puccinia striiformis f. sp. tritici PST-78 TaxID=1165861 RepID=A0A0L0W4E9_9BASI|nr:hypothetical protein Pst134EB_027338 [Puccinia striiformis f. sp. tritici]KAI7939454.1 hypothetical protein MJO29_014190 [Puccinia striiformis f. sp. tritici]KNF06155.1 hypothetical protein PSTG_00663 [Puccinia striiformis f. sp. tritici PST-78]